MPSIELETRVKATPEETYKLLKKPTILNKMVPEVNVVISENEDDQQITEWKIATEKEEFRWKQRENFDPEMLTIHCAFLEGDWQSYIARWQVNQAGEETDLCLQVEIVTKGKGVKFYLAWPFFRRRMRQLSLEIIQAFKDRLELSYGQST